MSATGLTLRGRTALPGGVANAERGTIAAAAVLATGAVVLLYAAFGLGAAEPIIACVLLLEVFALCVFRPYAALLAFVGFWGAAHVLLSGGGVEGGSTSVSQVIGITVLLGFAIAVTAVHGRRGIRPVPFPLRALAVFAGLYLVAEAITPFRSAGISDLIKLVGGLVLAFTGYYLIDSERRLLSLARVVGLAGVLVAGLALAQYASGYDFGLASPREAVGVYRATSALGSPSATGDFLLVCAGFVLVAYTLRRERSRARGDLAMLVIISLGTLVTFTRAAVIALLVLLLIWAVLWQIRAVGALGARGRLAAVLAVAAVALVQVVGAAALSSRAEGDSSSAGASFLNGRGAIWSNELHTLRSDGLGTLLIGSGAHTSYTSVYIPQSFAYREFPAHDLFLWLLIETGVLGLTVYVAALVVLARSLLRTARRARFTPEGKVAAVAFATTVAFTLDSLFHNTQLSTGSCWYFMLFLGAALRMTEPQPQASSRR